MDYVGNAITDKGDISRSWSKYFYGCCKASNDFAKAEEITQENRYLCIATSGGLNQQRTGMSDPDMSRSKGKCPLTPEEVGLMLTALSYSKDVHLYVALGELYRGEETLAPLKVLFPNFHSKETIASKEGLEPFSRFSFRMAVLDNIVCDESNVFVTNNNGNMANMINEEAKICCWLRLGWLCYCTSPLQGFKAHTRNPLNKGSKNHTKHFQASTILKNTSQAFKKAKRLGNFDVVRVLKIDRILLKDKGGADSGTMCARWATKGTASEVNVQILPIGIEMQYRNPSLGAGITTKVPVEPRREVEPVDDVMIPECDPIPEPESPPIDDSDDDPTEDVLEEETEHPVPEANGVIPMSYTDDDDDDEAIRAQFHEVHDISSSDPDSPLPPPATMHVAVHDWIVGQLNAEITAASARIAELRQALTAERATRLGYPRDFRAASPAIARREIDGIELRTRVQMRMTSVGGYIPVVDAEMMIAGAMRRKGTRAQPAESVNQQRGDPVVNEESEEDLDYNEYDEEEYIEEEAEDTQQGGNPMNEFMELLRENLNQQPIPPQPHAAQQTAATAFRTFKSLKPPEFLGSADPVEARAWLKEIEKSFEILGVEEQYKTIFASYMLKGEANYWWESKRNLESDVVILWDRFTRLFLGKYFPRFMETQMEIRFLELKYDKMTVGEYKAKFTELSRFVPEFVNTEEKKARSEQIVKEKENRKRKIGSQGIGTGSRSLPSRFDRGAVSQPARGPEFRKAPSESVGQGGEQSRATFHSQPRAPIPECQTCKKRHLGVCTQTRAPLRCYLCDQIGHLANNCTWPKVTCFQCGKAGHMKRDFPMLKPPSSGMSKAASNRPPAARTFNMTIQDAV
ncbi:hypothetical protein AgCh_017616 [Apium graveolens]